MRRLILVVLLLLATPRLGPAPAQAQADEVAIDIVDFAFVPATIEVPVGTTVTWTNQDGAPHTATADDGTFDSGTLEQGGSFSFTFEEAGTYPYHCEIHPNMTAVIVVVAAQEEATAEPTEEATEAPTEEATEEPTEEATTVPTAAATQPPVAVPTRVATAEPTEEAAGTPTGPTTALAGPTDGGPVLEFVGKVDQRGTDFSFYGYVTRVAGAEPAVLFGDPDPANWSEATARLTFFGSASLTSRSTVDDQLFVVVAEGTTTFYANERAGATFDRPESFFSGSAIAEADTTLRNVLAVVAPETGVVDGSGELTITSVTPFTLDGAGYEFGEVDDRWRVDYSGIGNLLEPTEPRAIVATAGAMTAVAPPADTPGEEPAAVTTEDAGTLTIPLAELNDSGISGSAALEAADEGLVVTLALDGAAGGHPVHIHRGTCDDLEPAPEYPLNDVDEQGASTTTVDGVTIEELAAEPYAVNVHLSNEEIGEYVACGDIEA